MRECSDCGATNMQVLGFACDHERCPMAYPIDPMCLELAEHMLGDIKEIQPEKKRELAEDLQKLCEDFVLVYRRDQERASQ